MCYIYGHHKRPSAHTWTEQHYDSAMLAKLVVEAMPLSVEARCDTRVRVVVCYKLAHMVALAPGVFFDSSSAVLAALWAWCRVGCSLGALEKG